MPTYQHPGVYVEEIPSGARPIESAGTSTAAIIGYARKGPIGEPELIFSWSQYKEQYGGVQDYSQNATGPKVDYMGHSVQAFFNNGGGKAYIVRLAPGATTSKGNLIAPNAAATTSTEITQKIAIEAINEGKWADGMEVMLTPNGAVFDLIIGVRNANGQLNVLESFDGVSMTSTEDNYIQKIVNGSSDYIVVDKANAGVIAVVAADLDLFGVGQITSSDVSGLDLADLFTPTKDFKITIDALATETVSFVAADGIVTLEDVAAKIQATINSKAGQAKVDFTCEAIGGTLVLTSGSRTKASQVTVAAGTTDAATLLGLLVGTTSQTGEQSIVAQFTKSATSILAGAVDGSAPVSPSDFEATFKRFRKIRDANIILLPDHQFSGSSKAIVDMAKAHAESMETAMVIIDPPSGTEMESAMDVAGLGLPASPYTVLYYPWAEVVNPHYHPELRAHLQPTYIVPPSGFAAGMWAKIDARRGVWKAPAGLGTGLSGIARTEYIVGNDEQDQLNPLGVNCYRRILSEPVVWGARTLATKANPEKRYVPVQRTTLMIKESIFQGIQWAVFEPNDHNLWASLRLNIETFMDGLHRTGAFQGEKASDAFFVSCGLGSTMTQGDIDAGRVIVEVGFAPLKPAEFVIVRIQQKTAQ